MIITIDKSTMLTVMGFLGGLPQYLLTIGFTFPQNKTEASQAAVSLTLATLGYLAKSADPKASDVIATVTAVVKKLEEEKKKQQPEIN